MIYCIQFKTNDTTQQKKGNSVMELMEMKNTLAHLKEEYRIQDMLCFEAGFYDYDYAFDSSYLNVLEDAIKELEIMISEKEEENNMFCYYEAQENFLCGYANRRV